MYVAIRTDTVKSPLEKLYANPYMVLTPGNKRFYGHRGSCRTSLDTQFFKPSYLTLSSLYDTLQQLAPATVAEVHPALKLANRENIL
ncbi:hypothetical protein PoB_003811500 [Plakobranchus ocellatus]|uniref:Uncharacterized protein n=1 Tax=Plakobranchus ocellatus TaxID=259542 RepID=A0AAV4AXS8_9GAST|nr:hypothetical protein PoB_003811500 [Plakobranchus ocellatus]